MELRMHSQPLGTTTTNSKCIGIVVIGRNERPRLERSLASIPSNFPVVYADSGSSDGSREMAEAAGATVVSLSADRQMTAARGRNAGARRLLELHPDVSFIQFVDGDCEIDSQWINRASEFLQAHSEVAVVCGQRSELHPDASIYNKLCDREWNTLIGKTESCGGDAMVRASAFFDIGGFRDDQLAHEEPELCSRLRKKGWTVWRIDQPMTTHDAGIFRMSQFYRRGKRGGTGMTQALARKGRYADAAAKAIIRRALTWSVVIPVAALIALLVDWRFSLGILMLYPIQWFRQTLIAKRQGFTLIEAMKVGFLSIVAKFAEAHGALDFFLYYKSGASKFDLSY